MKSTENLDALPTLSIEELNETFGGWPEPEEVGEALANLVKIIFA